MWLDGTLSGVAIPEIDPSSLSDREISDLIATLKAVQFERAVEACDTDALVELGFKEGFKADGLPRVPFLVGGILVCPGARIDKSATSHDCGFVRIDDAWVWESELKIADVVRNTAQRRVQMRSVSLVAVCEGTVVDLIYATARTGQHRLREARSYVVSSGELSLTQTRTPPNGFAHR